LDGFEFSPGETAGLPVRCVSKAWRAGVTSLGKAAVQYEQAATLWWSFFGAAKKKLNKATSEEENWNTENEIYRHSD
jgi:hypothetical protein